MLDREPRNAIALFRGKEGVRAGRPERGNRIHLRRSQPLDEVRESLLVDAVVVEWREGKHMRNHAVPADPTWFITGTDRALDSCTAIIAATAIVHGGIPVPWPLDAACWLLSQKPFTFGVQELFDLVHLSGLDVDHLLG